MEIVRRAMDEDTAAAIERSFISPNVADSNLEPANIVDVLDSLARQVGGVRKAITPNDCTAGTDATGGHVSSLTEAVMGLTAGMVQIAHAIDGLADAVRSRDESA